MIFRCCSVTAFGGKRRHRPKQRGSKDANKKIRVFLFGVSIYNSEVSEESLCFHDEGEHQT